MDNNEKAIEAVRALHVSDNRWSCGMQSPRPVMGRHSWSKEYEADLTCTLDAGHEGDHRDGNHCWVPHTFKTAVPGPMQHDRRRCSCGWTNGECPTTAALDTILGTV